MPNGSENNSQSQDIGSLLLQADRWARIEDGVKGGVPVLGIAKALLEEDDEIRVYYERTGSKNPQKTLSNVIGYHLREQMTFAERVGYSFARHFFDHEVGDIDILRELKQMVELQKERAGKAIELERRIGVVTAQAGREMMILLHIYNMLGKLMLAAGLDIRGEEEHRYSEDEKESSGGNRVLYMFLEVLRRQGYSDKWAIELITGVRDMTRENNEPDPLGLGEINLLDMVRRATSIEKELHKCEQQSES